MPLSENEKELVEAIFDKEGLLIEEEYLAELKRLEVSFTLSNSERFHAHINALKRLNNEALNAKAMAYEKVFRDSKHFPDDEDMKLIVDELATAADRHFNRFPRFYQAALSPMPKSIVEPNLEVLKRELKFPISRAMSSLKILKSRGKIISESQKKPAVPNVSPHIVRSWFREVIDPLLTSFKLSATLLEHKNWSWQAQPANLQDIITTQSICFSGSVLRQFLGFYPILRESFEIYDQEVANLFTACKELHKAIEENEDFNMVYEAAKEDERTTSTSPIDAVLSQSSDGDRDHRQFLAQAIVNNKRQGDLNFTYRVPWDKFHTQFLAIANAPQAYPDIYSKKGATDRAGEKLLRTVRELIGLLENEKNELSIKFGVPLSPQMYPEFIDYPVKHKGANEHLMTAKKVFISYNHEDSPVADKLKSALEAKGFLVTIDREAMRAGASIQEFIENSIRDADVTLSIVSNRSLLSAWVALESITTLYREKLEREKRFIACFIDDDFFKPDFRLKATRQINARIEELDKLLPEYIAEKIDTNDLNSQKSRLIKLRNELGDILLKLRDSLTLDIRDSEFDKSLARIVQSIEELPSRP
jgi:hypothetical protein